MWGDPRPGTEADNVNKLVEKRKKQAEESGIDRLFCDTYFDILKTYPTWIKNEHNNVIEYIFPTVTKAEETPNGIVFKLADKTYKIETERKYGYDNPYYEMKLFLNDRKVFGIDASEDSNPYATFYYPNGINAYVNDDWVNDFKEIQHHHKLINKKREILWAENKERTDEKRQNFGITKEEVISYSQSEISSNHKKGVWEKWWFWIIIFIIFLIFI